MPLYEYECTQCHRRLEKIQKFSDPELTVCPHCAGVLERTVTAPAIQFKGAGWYKDLYSSAKPPAPPSGEAGSPAAAGGEASSSTAKTEAAPAAASTPAAPASSGTSSSN